MFDELAERYDSWYDRNWELYKKELEIVKPPASPSLEVGVGSGRFAAPLGIDVGVDVSLRMLKIAKRRGVECVLADAARLPFRDATFRSVYVIFTLCFLEEPLEALQEVARVLRDDGYLVVCIIPLDSGLGEEYSAKGGPFYSRARFYRENEVAELLETAGFQVSSIRKTRLKYSENDFVCFECRKVHSQKA